MAVWRRGYRTLAVLALAACGGRSTVGLTSDGSYGVAASGGSAPDGGNGNGSGALGGNGARSGVSGYGGTGGVGTTGRGASSGAPAGGASGRSGGGAGGSAGKVPNVGDDPYLKSLTVQEGYLAPKFDPQTFLYSLTVPRGTKSLTIEAVPKDPDAVVEIGGTSVDGPIELSIENAVLGEVPVTVTAPSGSRSTTHVSFYEELLESSTYLKPSSTSEFQSFGISVAVSGDTVAVGAYTEVGATVSGGGLNPTGAVYVYVKGHDGWRQQTYLTPTHRDPYDQFGYSVALSGDTLVVGAPGEDGSESGVNGDETDNGTESAGAVYVFVRNGGTWTQQAYVKGASPEMNAYFGGSVALAGDTLVAGSPGQSGPDDGAGQPFAAGSATVLVREGTTWSQAQTLWATKPTDESRFGASLALSGDILAVGALGEGSQSSGTRADETGVGAPASGAVYVFARSGQSWAAEAFIKAKTPTQTAYFGDSVAVSGDWLVVGEPSSSGGLTSTPRGAAVQAGAAYVYRRAKDHWDEVTTLLPSNGGEGHHFGARVAIDGELIAVGAPGETGSSSGINGDPSRGGAYLSGAAYVFARAHGTWYQREYVKAITSDPNDGFGIGVSLADGKFAVGAYGESSHATGVNGDSTDDSVQGAGAAYVYDLAD